MTRQSVITTNVSHDIMSKAFCSNLQDNSSGTIEQQDKLINRLT